MRHLNSLQEIHLKNAWVTIGSFDGVHIGHQFIIGNLVKAAHSASAPAVVVTFFPHPAVVLRGIPNPYYLSTPDERAHLLDELGVDVLVTLPFDKTMAELGAEAFIDILHEHLGIRELWVGEGFALGKDRQGDVSRLVELGKRHGFSVNSFEPVKVGEEIVSSSAIRKSLAAGDVARVSDYLGRPYRISGEVVHGAGRGHKLGFPTANLQINPIKLLPTNGIYVTWVWWQRKRFPGVTNIGMRPTYDDHLIVPSVEPYMIDFDQDLYGENLTLEFIHYIRPEEKFATEYALVQRIQDDIRIANEVFSHAPRTPRIPA
jgi:riboflavin kinase/FMN adenylyltransferase